MFEIERAENGLPQMPTPRIKWPWKDMRPGDVVKISDQVLASKAQINCHTYGNKFGKKFATRTIGGVLHVYRVE
jgi:hypothetical protein